MSPLQDSHHEGGHYEGPPFPSEAEWLQMMAAGPGGAMEPPVSSDFVDRIMRALRQRAGHDAEAAAPEAPACEDDAAGDAANDLPADVLREFTAPEPSRDFVPRTVAAVRADRRSRWRELLARYVAPEPSPEFVARTVSALTAVRRIGDRDGEGGAAGWADTMAARRRGRWWRRPWPLLAAAAATLLLWFAPWTTARAPIELRLSHEPAYAYSYAPTPLPAVLASLHHAADPSAWNEGGADGVWLLLGSKQ